MRRMKRRIAWALAIVTLLLAVLVVPTVWLRPWSIDHYYARVFLEFALRHPMLLTQLGVLDGTPIAFYRDDLDDFSLAFEEREIRFLDRQIRILHQYRRDRLEPKARLSYDVLDYFLTNQQEGNRFRFHGYPVNQLNGIQSELPEFMISVHPLKRPSDAADYVERVGRLATALDQVVEGLEARRSKGLVPPRFVLRKAVDQMRGFRGHPARANPLFEHFAARTDTLNGLEPRRRAELLVELERAIEQRVYPAYDRLIASCQRLERSATDDDGVWKLPDGEAYYAWCLRNHTTTTLPADTIHALGVREVDRIQRQMRAILRSQGYPTADLAATMDRVKAEPRFGFGAGDSARQRILAGYQAIVEDADRRSRSLFNVRPKAGVKVERVPPFREANAPGAYYRSPSIGGGRPGVFYANLRDPTETSRLEMRTLAYHEAIPGHHFQNGIALELRDVPFFRRVVPFTAYGEGWGLYAERLALEHGFHQDAFDSLGALQAELFRAVRLVVDTGIHAQRWTRQRAIDYMRANTGIAETEVVTEIERYIVAPGQACAYKVGQLELLELRRRAMDRLGPRFDIRRFHDVVLTNGELPLTLLERVIDDWIAAGGRGGGAPATDKATVGLVRHGSAGPATGRNR
jgi:uncharacterized protein (DUF885 family)